MGKKRRGGKREKKGGGRSKRQGVTQSPPMPNRMSSVIQADGTATAERLRGSVLCKRNRESRLYFSFCSHRTILKFSISWISVSSANEIWWAGWYFSTREYTPSQQLKAVLKVIFF